MTIPVLRFDPRQSGLRCWLGSLEAEVMAVIWQERRAALKRGWRIIGRDHTLVYTSILVTATRLHQKGLVTRVKAGAAYVYTPVCTEDEFIEMQVGYVLAALEESKGCNVR